MKLLLTTFFEITVYWCLLTSPPTKAQDVLVQCSEAGSDDCTNSNAGNIALLEVTYSSCCSMVKAEDRYYLDQDQNCRRCGPILDEKRTLPTTSTNTLVVISWEISASSFIPATGFTIGSREEGTVTILPSAVPADAFSLAFLVQSTGVSVTYYVRGMSDGGGSSPAIEVTWITGRSLAPSLTDFTTTYLSTSAVNIEWVLEFNGVRPLQNMVLTWSLPENDNIGTISTTTVTLNQTQPNGAKFDRTYAGLKPGARYSLQVDASNSEHTATIFYTVDTNATIESPTPALTQALSLAVVLSPFPSLYLLLLHPLCLN